MPSTDRSQPDAEVESSELVPGDLLDGKYRIEGLLGGGGIGAVYRAVQLPLERPVAIKVLHDDLLTMKELRARFEREARVLSALTHPHVVSISDYGIDGDRPFLVMELLEGRTLEEVLRKGDMTPQLALDVTREILEGLAFAHEKGVAHRDLKPANVFLLRGRDENEHVKLLDFGLARVVSTKGAEDDEVTLTKRGVVFGTPAYMSPEQAAGTPADERSDIYSLGILLFEMLAGRRPFVGETRAEVLRGHLADPLPRLASVRPELRAHEDLVELLDIATAKSPSDRYADGSAMLAALEALPDDPAWLVDPAEVSVAATQVSIKPPPVERSRVGVGVAVGAGAVAAIGALALAFVWGSDEPRPTPPPVVEEAVEVPENSTPGRPAARDPWEGDIPEPLLPFHAMVEDDYVFQERREIQPLYALARAMPDDPRPLLLLAHLFVGRGWYTLAIERYERAYALDETVRGDPRMLRFLVRLASRDSVGDLAAAAIERIYGPEALTAVQTGIDDLSGQALPQLRLVQLRDRLRDPP
ncbi:MAG: serine/threonine protein kinase [Sandaracinaceae bacterium]|nr:serine/threonine protein kinase [Sandaracinaceae bacterium]